MDRERFYAMMSGSGTFDYEIYLKTKALLTCQKDFAELCNQDELQFQIVHQVEELWMKLLAYTLLDIDDYMQQRQTNRVLTLFRRVHLTVRLMTDQLALLETMSPKEYQEIRVRLGNGSGQESPGFRTLLKMTGPLWTAYVTHYLNRDARTLDQVYNVAYAHDDAYMVGEALAEFDALFQKFRYHHLQLVYRTLGPAATSLKGRDVETLNRGLRTPFFPELWNIRRQMTDSWGGQYGITHEASGGD